MTGPKVAIDAIGLSQRSKGVPRVLRNLLRELPRAGSHLEYVALVDGLGAAVMAEEQVDVDFSVHEPKRGFLWELGGAHRAASATGADILYTNREALFALNDVESPNVALHIHEPPWFRRDMQDEWPRRGWRPRTKDRLIAASLPSSVRRAAAVIASSHATAEALERKTGVVPRVVHLGVDPRFLEQARVASAREPFLLHLSSGDPRENALRVLQAWALCGRDDYGLKVVGASGPLKEQLRFKVAASGLEKSVEVLGWVTDEELASLYGRCTALLGPSLYEGFGFEALEAMAHGTPVIAGDGPASREILGDAAVLVEPRSIEAIAAAISWVIEDLEVRDRLRGLGPERAAMYTWEETAKGLTEVFDSVLHSVVP